MNKYKQPDVRDGFFIGRLVRDPEMRVIASGTEITKFDICAAGSFKTRRGETREEKAFVTCEVWGHRAKFVDKYFKKGRPIVVRGKFKTETWKTPDGQNRSKLILKVSEVQHTDWEDDEEGE